MFTDTGYVSGGSIGSAGETTGGSGSGTAGTGGTSGQGTSGTTGADSDPGNAPKFDVGTHLDLNGAGDAGGGVGCKKIDFLFVVDNSGSMHNEQVSLINSFPGFISSIQNTVDAQDYHIMVVDTDACGEQVCPNPPADCRDHVGAGRVSAPDGTSCGIGSGGRFVTQDQAMLFETFSCMGLVGTDGWGHHEVQAASLVKSITFEAQLGGCNEGFLREDAILVVTMITDEDDLGSMGNPLSWKQDIVNAKNGDESAIVMLGLLGDVGCVEAPPAPILRDLFESFSGGQVGSVCVPDYAPFFDEAVSKIDLACDDFVPPG